MIRKMTCRAALAAALSIPAHAATTITYEDAVLGVQGFINNAPYSAAGVTHANINSGGYWEGFSISNHTDNTTSGNDNQYSSYTGGGAGGSSNFAVGYYGAFLSTDIPRLTFLNAVDFTGKGADFTNTTYTALDMLNGSGFSKKFGGVSGTDPDWLLLTITGYHNNLVTGSASLYLADYRNLGGSPDYILNTWQHVDFTPLGTASEVRFSMSSTDMFGAWLNTPAYFAMDNLVVPEASTLGLTALGGLFLLRRHRPERRVPQAS